MGVRKCTECGFTHKCVHINSHLCGECDKDYERCISCQRPCRSKEETERIFKKMKVIE
jgi:hypothetical protein